MRSADLRRFLRTPGYSVRCVEETGSTNTDLRRLSSEGAPDGTVLIADRQTAGRGRMGRSFYSPEKTGVYCSVLLRPDLPASDGVFLTVTAAVAAAEALESEFGISPQIKWVNDLMLHDRKIAGILTEGESDPDTGILRTAVIGIGLNLLPPADGFPPELRGIAGSVFSAPPLPDDCAERFCASFLDRLADLRNAPRSGTVSAYRSRFWLDGKTVFSPSGAFAGTAEVLGTDDALRLVIRTENGRILTLESGEVSVKPVFPV